MSRRPSFSLPSPSLPGRRLLRQGRRTLRPDAFAGLSVAAYLVPQCLAYAQLAGVEPVRGLWAAAAALVAYAALGTSTLVSVGPESTTALMVGAVVASIAVPGDAQSANETAAALALAVAAVGVLAWMVRLGALADLLSRPS